MTHPAEVLQEKKQVATPGRVGLLAVSPLLLLLAAFLSYQTSLLLFSGFLGAFCVWLPSVVFIFTGFLKKTRAPSVLLKQFYLGGAVKFFAMILSCVLVFAFIPIQPLAFFAGFIVAQVGMWCVFLSFKV